MGSSGAKGQGSVRLNTETLSWTGVRLGNLRLGTFLLNKLQLRKAPVCQKFRSFSMSVGTAIKATIRSTIPKQETMYLVLGLRVQDSEFKPEQSKTRPEISRRTWPVELPKRSGFGAMSFATRKTPESVGGKPKP